MTEEIHGVCPMCGRRRLGLKIEDYVSCELCTNYMIAKYGDLYYLDDNMVMQCLGKATNPLLYRRFDVLKRKLEGIEATKQDDRLTFEVKITGREVPLKGSFIRLRNILDEYINGFPGSFNGEVSQKNVLEQGDFLLRIQSTKTDEEIWDEINAE